MATDKLTDKQVKSANFAKYGKRKKLSDGGGMYLDIQPSGKYWRMKYRFDGKEKTLALGVYPDVSLKLARQKRAEARAQLAEGVDPNESKRQAKATQKERSDTFRIVAEDWLKLKKGELADSTLEVARKRLETWAYPKLGHLPIAHIKPAQVLETLREIEAQGKHETAHRIRQRIGEIYRYAVAEGRAETDPTSTLKGLLKTVPTRHRAAITSEEKLGTLLRAMDAYGGHASTRAALKLAPLLFLRPGELRNAEWTEIDLQSRTWVVPGKRMKGTLKAKRAGQVPDHIVPLSKQAVLILKELYALTGHQHLVFESVRSGRPLSENTINVALKSMGFDGTTMVGHGFRATASTLLHEQGWQPEVIELQLAHKQRNQVAATYNRSARLKERTKMMQAWADYLFDLKTDK
ncbi:tyrosine-type recombinase/integrase [Marinobacter pelagius]|uniref:tyrosine-type recombinase/integrase n=1 Tax=Marinobacter sp. C7 TaxID=2951363 RepID=UPI001EEFF1EF|nr:integrase arm-type DNA-binding domain-containing protein [Marinobacter sp. C7]MCG7201467.1 tyrosine-type recombinase/integrase [Marinobacter sp. C7]